VIRLSGQQQTSFILALADASLHASTCAAATCHFEAELALANVDGVLISALIFASVKVTASHGTLL
jgi:hypothetical protein